MWLVSFRLGLAFGVLLTAILTIAGTPAPGDETLTGPLPHYVEVRDSGLNFVHINGDRERKDYIPEAKGGGIGFLDYDGDGWLDLFVAQGSTVDRFRSGDNPRGSLFRNRRDGTFEEVTEQAGLTRTGWGMGVSAADYNNDGLVDLYLTFLGPNVLYRNNGDGTFTDVTESAGVGDPRWSTSAAFGDYDRDGDLDLYVANYITLDFDNLPQKRCRHRGATVMCGPRGLTAAADILYRNNGDGTFTDVTRQAGVEGAKYYGLGVVWADLDNDEDSDLVVANDATPNLFFVNQGDGTFQELGFASGLAVSADGQEQAGMGIDAADFDNDGLIDVYMTHFAMEYSTLYQNRGDLMFEDITAQARIMEPELPLVSWGVRFVDFNHDGWKDLIHSNGHVYPYLLQAEISETYAQPKSFYLNDRKGSFQDVSHQLGPDVQVPQVGRGMAFGDYDNDGDIDFAAANMNGPPSLYRCDSSPNTHWVLFQTVGQKSNRDGIGVRINVDADGIRQGWEIKRTVGIYSVSDPRAHFGLGKASRIERVEVRWPSGTRQVFTDVESNAHYLIDEVEGLKKTRGSK